MPGAKPVTLFDNRDGIIKRQSRLGHRFGPVPCNDNHPFWPQRLTRAQCVMQQRGRANLVQSLRQIGIHPRALSCGEDNQ